MAIPSLEAVDAAKNCKKLEFSSITRRWRNDASYRDTQQTHGWSLEYCMFLDYLKKIPMPHRATQEERNRYTNHFVLKWKNPTNPGIMSIHENCKDAVTSRATMAYQGEGYAYIAPQDRARQRLIDLQLSSQLREECQQWSHIR